MPSSLALQIEFCCLSVPDLQNVVSMDEAMEQEVFSRTGSSHSSKGQSLDQQCTLMTLENAAAVLAVSESNTRQEECVSHEIVDISNASTNLYDPERKLRAPTAQAPRRFFRTFWRSTALRLLMHAATNSAALTPCLNEFAHSF